MSRLYQWVKSGTVQALQDFMASGKGKVFHTTVGERDIVYLPAGYMFFEVVGPQDSILYRQ